MRYIYLFKKNDRTPRDWDQSRGFVVIADSEEEARNIIQQHMDDESELHLNHLDFDCTYIGNTMNQKGIVLQDYLRG